ncbi:MAG: Ada metal-binding domain-containing protein [Gemmatimonadales bacterium]
MKKYRLLAPTGETIESAEPGTLGGNRRARIYGRLDCPSASRALPNDYARHRVFFADRAAAIGAGYRPCGVCLREEYEVWKMSRQRLPDDADARASTTHISHR